MRTVVAFLHQLFTNPDITLALLYIFIFSYAITILGICEDFEQRITQQFAVTVDLIRVFLTHARCQAKLTMLRLVSENSMPIW